jgi:hypothetical protein
MPPDPAPPIYNGVTALALAAAGLLMGIPAILTQYFAIRLKVHDNRAEVKLLTERIAFTEGQLGLAREDARRWRDRADHLEALLADRAHLPPIPQEPGP